MVAANQPNTGGETGWGSTGWAGPGSGAGSGSGGVVSGQEGVSTPEPTRPAFTPEGSQIVSKVDTPKLVPQEIVGKPPAVNKIFEGAQTSSPTAANLFHGAPLIMSGIAGGKYVEEESGAPGSWVPGQHTFEKQFRPYETRVLTAAGDIETRYSAETDIGIVQTKDNRAVVQISNPIIRGKYTTPFESKVLTKEGAVVTKYSFMGSNGLYEVKSNEPKLVGSELAGFQKTVFSPSMGQVLITGPAMVNDVSERRLFHGEDTMVNRVLVSRAGVKASNFVDTYGQHYNIIGQERDLIYKEIAPNFISRLGNKYEIVGIGRPYLLGEPVPPSEQMITGTLNKVGSWKSLYANIAYDMKNERDREVSKRLEAAGVAMMNAGGPYASLEPPKSNYIIPDKFVSNLGTVRDPVRLGYTITQGERNGVTNELYKIPEKTSLLQTYADSFKPWTEVEPTVGTVNLFGKDVAVKVPTRSLIVGSNEGIRWAEGSFIAEKIGDYHRVTKPLVTGVDTIGDLLKIKAPETQGQPFSKEFGQQVTYDVTVGMGKMLIETAPMLVGLGVLGKVAPFIPKYAGYAFGAQAAAQPVLSVASGKGITGSSVAGLSQFGTLFGLGAAIKHFPIRYGDVLAQVRPELGKLEGVQKALAESAVKSGGYIGGSAAIKLQLPKGSFRTPGDVDIYFSGASKEVIATKASGLFQVAKSYYSNKGVSSTAIDKFLTLEGSGKEAFVKDNGVIVADIRARALGTDVVKQVGTLNVRGIEQIVADKQNVVKFVKAGEGKDAKLVKAKKDIEMVAAAELISKAPITAVYRGLFLTAGEGTAVPLVGLSGTSLSNTKLVLGTEGVFGKFALPRDQFKSIFYPEQARRNVVTYPQSALETSILSSRKTMEALGASANDIRKVEITKEFIRELKDVPSIYTDKDFIKKTEFLNEKEVDSVLDTLIRDKPQGFTRIHGTFATMPQMRKEVRRMIGDIEINFDSKETATAGAELFKTNLEAIGTKTTMVASDKGVVLSKGPNKVLDIHFKGDTSMEAWTRIGDSRYGYLEERAPMFMGSGKIKIQTLGEQTVRKAGASATWWTGEKGGVTVEPGLHRPKDVADTVGIVRTLASSKLVTATMRRNNVLNRMRGVPATSKMDLETYANTMKLVGEYRNLEWKTPGVQEKFAELDAGVDKFRAGNYDEVDFGVLIGERIKATSKETSLPSLVGSGLSVGRLSVKSSIDDSSRGSAMSSFRSSSSAKSSNSSGSSSVKSSIDNSSRGSAMSSFRSSSSAKSSNSSGSSSSARSPSVIRSSSSGSARYPSSSLGSLRSTLSAYPRLSYSASSAKSSLRSSSSTSSSTSPRSSSGSPSSGRSSSSSSRSSGFSPSSTITSTSSSSYPSSSKGGAEDSKRKKRFGYGVMARFTPKRTVYADIFSVGHSEVRYGSGTHQANPKLPHGELGRIPTVEMRKYENKRNKRHKMFGR